MPYICSIYIQWDENTTDSVSDLNPQHMFQSGISLLAASDSLHLTVTGPLQIYMNTVKTYIKTLKLLNINKINFIFNQTSQRGEYSDAKDNKPRKAGLMYANKHLSEGESSTIIALHDYCKNEVKHNRKTYVYYIHSKGSCCVRNPYNITHSIDPVASWREVMDTFAIEFPSICLRALNLGYIACGMEQSDATAHYSGNFWWSTCDHVARLPPLNDRFDAWESGKRDRTHH